MSAAPDLVLIEKARRESLDATQRRIDAAAKPFAAALAAWLRRFAAVEAARALRDPRAYAGARIDVAKARTPTEPELRGELERLLRMFGLRAAGDAANRTAGEVVIPASLYRDAVSAKDVRIKWFWELEKELTRKVDDILESTRQAARDSVKRILVDASREKVQPSTGEIARRIRTSFSGPGDVERPHRVHATEGERAFAFSSERAALIARTETVQAENTGIFGGYVATGVEEVEWLAYSDGRSGDRHHERMKGERVRVGEYFTLPSGAKLRYPGDPLGPIGETVNCFPGETRVMARGVRRIFRRWYSGDLVEIRTTLGHHLTGTPNHPVLTPEGWIALGALDEGGHVFSGGRLDPLLGAHRDDDDAPPTLEQVFRLSSGGDRALHVGSPLDFHGDGQGHEVDVVSVDGELRDRLDAALAKHRSKLGLADADAAQRDLLLSGSLDHLGSGAALPANGIVSRGGEGGALLGGALLHAQEHRLGAVAGLDPGPAQPNGDARSRDTELGGDRLHAAALLEESHDGFDGDLWSSHVLDSVVSTSRRAWSGFVYTLETERGSFAASGVVVHNCRCSLRAVRTKSAKPKAVPPVRREPSADDYVRSIDRLASQRSTAPGDEIRSENILAVDPAKLSREERDVLEAVTVYSAGNVAAVRDPSKFSAAKASAPIPGPRFRWPGGDEVLRVPPTREAYETANRVFRALATRPTRTRATMWRGMHLPAGAARALTPGAEFDTGTIASWSTSQEIAVDFTWDGAKKGELGVLMRMVPRHGARIDALSRYADEAEFISSGRVRVVRVTETPEYLLVDVEPLPLDPVAKRRAPEPDAPTDLDADARAAILAAFGRRQVRAR